MRGLAISSVAVLLPILAALPYAQGTRPAAPLTVVSKEARRPLPTTMAGGQELLALADIAALFQVAIREDAVAGGVTLTYRGRTIVVSADQPLASVNGRVVTLSSSVVKAGSRWLVPLDFLTRALGPIYDQRIELRRPSRLVLVGDVRIPRVTARIDAGPPTRATIEITPAAPVTSSTEGTRVLVRIDADALDAAFAAAGTGLVEQIRTEAANTIAIALAPGAAPPRVSVASADGTTRVVIDVASAAAPSTQDSTAPEPRPAPSSPAPASPLASAGNSVPVIVLDPGHGGEDVGVRSPGGIDEKQFTLDVARRVRTLIETRIGLRVILTRDDDRFVALDDRAAVANSNKADVFLSLHANAAPAASVAGAEVFHTRGFANATADKPSEPGEDATGDRRPAPAATLPVLGGGTRSIDVIPWERAQARHAESSAVLAGVLEQELRQRVPMSVQPLRQVEMRVLAAANMPAALVEMAYLTNPQQDAQARGDNLKNNLAQAIFESIVRFRAHLDGGRTR